MTEEYSKDDIVFAILVGIITGLMNMPFLVGVMFIVSNLVLYQYIKIFGWPKGKP